MLHNLLSGKPLYQVIQCKFFHQSFFFCQIFCKLFQDHFPRVRKCVNRMTHTINQTCPVKSLFVQNLIKISGYFFFICPVVDMGFDVIKHILNFQVGTTVTRSFQ